MTTATEHHPERETVDGKWIASYMNMSWGHVRQRLLKQPDFPVPVVAYSPRSRRWKKADVIEYLSKPKDQK